MLSCNETENKKPKHSIIPQTTTQTDCKQSIAFGDIDVCIPKIKGYQNVYNKQHQETMKRLESNEGKGNQIIGYYVNSNSYENEVYRTLDNSDYFKIYSVKDYRNLHATPNDLSKLYNIMQDGFIKEIWDSINEKYDEIGRDLEIDRPVILDSYKTTENFNTIIFLMKFSYEGGYKLILVASNLLLIENRIIYFAYYLTYNNENLDKIKQMNNYIGLKILDENT